MTLFSVSKSLVNMCIHIHNHTGWKKFWLASFWSIRIPVLYFLVIYCNFTSSALRAVRYHMIFRICYVLCVIIMFHTHRGVSDNCNLITQLSI